MIPGDDCCCRCDCCNKKVSYMDLYGGAYLGDLSDKQTCGPHVLLICLCASCAELAGVSQED